MTPEDEIDQLPVTQQLGDLHSTRALAMEALDSMINKMQIALEGSANRYQDLFAKYLDLKDIIADSARHVTGQVEDAGVEGYVMALIDAHSHNFMDPFFRGSDDDGAAAAKRVEGIITEILRRDHPDLAGLRVLTRVYADVQLLSSQLMGFENGERSKHNDSLRSFVQGFSSASSFSDFIDVSHRGPLAEKMLGVFELHLQDSRCKHILVNVARGSMFLDMLATNPSRSKNTTNVPEALARMIPDYMAKAKVGSPIPDVERLGSDGAKGVPAHDDANPGGRSRGKTTTYGYFENNRYIVPASPDPAASTARSNKKTSHQMGSLSAQADRIPINASGHRVDLPLRLPTKAERSAYKGRTRRKNLCSAFHLKGHCSLKSCHFDHGHVNPSTLNVLRQKVRGWPCDLQGSCRRKDCIHGHVCLVEGCPGPGDQKCNFSAEAHHVDLRIHEWVLPQGRITGHFREPRTFNGGTKVDDSKGSMENWPTMVADLIEI